MYMGSNAQEAYFENCVHIKQMVYEWPEVFKCNFDIILPLQCAIRERLGMP